MTACEIRIPVDPSNPGHFFACCGLFELADRLWRETAAYFSDRSFVLRSERDDPLVLAELLREFKKAQAAAPGGTGHDEDTESDTGDEDSADPLELAPPFALRLDWWTDKSLKTWAGSMNARVIFAAMTQAIDEASDDPFADCRVVYDAVVPTSENGGARRRSKPQKKKREPFYFDARRGANARAIDVGFAPDALEMTSAACPAVEALCFVGLQRFRPRPTDRPRVFDYWAWQAPMPLVLASVAACGLLPGAGGTGYRFENAFRTDQRKHKGFMPAERIGENR